MKSKVYVGLSGGVDSAVAASLLLDDGYDVTGVFLKNWSSDDYGINDQCPWEEDYKSAEKVANFLKIPIKTYNFEKEYRKLVIEDFYYQYSIGNTPNPDVLCNKFIKFGTFLDKAIEDGANFIATGHYSNTINGHLFKAKDKTKDQTYFLHQVTSEQLKKTLFPLGNLTKKEVRQIALEKQLPNAKRKDSQGICFIGKVDIEDFLSKKLKKKVGNIVDIDSNEAIGKHDGVWFYTIGQRKGIGVGGVSAPYFISKKDVSTDTLFVAKSKSHKALWKSRIEVQNLHLINKISSDSNLTGTIRYRSPDTSISFDMTGKAANIQFVEKQWAPAIGQSFVLFEGKECLGGGVITKID